MSVPILPFLPTPAEPALPGAAKADTSTSAGSLFAALVTEAAASGAAVTATQLSSGDASAQTEQPSSDMPADAALAALAALNPQVLPQVSSPTGDTAAQPEQTVAPPTTLPETPTIPAPAVPTATTPVEEIAPQQVSAPAAPTAAAPSDNIVPAQPQVPPTVSQANAAPQQPAITAPRIATSPAAEAAAVAETATGAETPRTDLPAQTSTSAKADVVRNPAAMAALTASAQQAASMSSDVVKASVALDAEPANADEARPPQVTASGEKPVAKPQDPINAVAQTAPSRNGDAQTSSAQTSAPQASAPQPSGPQPSAAQPQTANARADNTPTPSLPAANALPTMTLVQEIGFANAAPLQASFTQSGAIRLTSLPGGTRDFEALAVRVAQHAVAGDSRFDIRLDPPELGGIEVRLDVDRSGHVQAQLTAERPQTLDLLQRDAAALERALKEAGLDLGSDLSFSLKGDGRQGLERDADARRAPTPQGDERSMSAPIAAASLAQRYYGADTRLDITV